MGNMQAMDMADAINKKWIDLGTALHWHLRYNHYPPLPVALIETAKTAIERANEGDFDSQIELPQDISFRGRSKMSVYDAVEYMRLNTYVNHQV